MAEDHDEPREEDHEVEPPPSDEVAAALLERFPGTIFADSHGQAVVYVDRVVWLDVATYLRDEQQFHAMPRRDRGRPDRRVLRVRNRPASRPNGSRWWPTSSPTPATVASA